MDPIDFAAFFKEKIKAKGLTFKKVSDLSGIPLKHIEHLSTGEYDRLPPAPYVRGYLNVLGELLQFDPLPIWEHFKTVSAIPSSGSGDRLPLNRFAPRPLIGYVWVGVATVVLLGYLGFRFSKIFGQPVLRVENPHETLATVSSRDFIVRGNLENGDTLLVNGEVTSLGQNGGFEKRITLQPGLNTLQISAKKFLGKEISLIRQVMYEPVSQPPTAHTSTSEEVITP